MADILVVPSLIAKILEIKIADAKSKKQTSTTFKNLGFVADVFTFADELQLIKNIDYVKQIGLEKELELVTESITIDDRPCWLMLAKNCNTDLLYLDNKIVRNKSLVESDMEELKEFSRLLGFNIVYCLSGPIIASPFSEKPNTIYLFAHSRPPGFLKAELKVQSLFGIDLWKKRDTRILNKPTAGRGRIIKCEDTPIFQVLGFNYYQICLVDDEEIHEVLNRQKIFRRLLSCLYADVFDQLNSHSKNNSSLTEEQFIAFGKEPFGVIENLTKSLEKVDLGLKKIEQELSEKINERHKIRMLIQSMQEAESSSDLVDRLPKEFDEIKKVDGFVTMNIVDGGLNIDTDPIIIEHEGFRYNFGKFVVRLDPKNCRIDVWNDAPRHPDGHHHPHIDRKNLACFGNITIALKKLMIGHRWAEAFLLLMRWLKNYSPENTLHPIEEWPSEKI